MHESLVSLWEASCRKYKDRNHFGTKSGGSWAWITYGEFKELVDAVRGGLVALGVGPTDRVAMVSDNSIEWAATAYATYSLGGVFVPMYTAQQPDEWVFIIKDSDAKVVVVANETIYEQLVERKDRMPELDRIICVALPTAHGDSYQALLASGRHNPSPVVHPKADDVAAFIYTSGTTGVPKGVVLTHKNFCSNTDACREVFPLYKERSLAFLPWAHALGQTGELHFFTQEGHTIAINDDVTRLVTNLPEVRPSLLVAVPRIFNRIYESVNRQMDAKPRLVQVLFERGLSLAQRRNGGEVLSTTEQLVLAAAEKLIFSKVRAKFGGRLKLVISGSAALNPDVARFVDALGIMVYEGYGLTETAPVVSVNYPGARKIGSVGKPLPGVRVEIDGGRSETPGEGELIVYGPNVMRGYHNRPEETAGVFTEDGGFRTGDLGRKDEDGYLYITGRLKELYKLENGRYIAPAVLEEQIKLSPFIANVMLFGANKAHNVALVVPERAALEEWSDSTGTPVGDLSNNPRVSQLILGEIDKFAGTFKSYERPRKVALLAEDFTTENGLLTPSMKVKRQEVAKKYASLLEGLYRS